MSTASGDERVAVDEWLRQYRDKLGDQAATDQLYTDWAQTYDKEMASLGFATPRVCGEYFHKFAQDLGLGQDCSVLDVAGGTGLAALEMRKYGYHNIDVADPCEAMLQEAQKVNAYRKYLVCGTGDNQQMPIQDDSYDASIVCSALPHIQAGGIRDMVRVTRPGGLFLVAGRTNYMTEDGAFMMPTLDALEADGMVEKIEVVSPPLVHYHNILVLIAAYKVL